MLLRSRPTACSLSDLCMSLVKASAHSDSMQYAGCICILDYYSRGQSTSSLYTERKVYSG